MAERPLKRARTAEEEDPFDQLPLDVFAVLILQMHPLDVASFLAASPWVWRRVWPQLRRRYTEKWSTVWHIGDDYKWNQVGPYGRRTHQIFKVPVTYKTRICDVWEFGINWEYSYTQFPCYFDESFDGSRHRWDQGTPFCGYRDLYFIHNNAHLLPFFVEKNDGTFYIDLNFSSVHTSGAHPEVDQELYVKKLRTGELVTYSE